MALMDRIKIKDFLSLSDPMQTNFIDTVRKARASAITFALAQRKKKIPRVKIAGKKRAKSPRAQANKKSKAEAALAKLTPDQIEKLSKLF
jgi:hypothetical protein